MLIIGGHPEDWGIIPTFLNTDDERSAKEQIHAQYQGGWNNFDGFTLDPDTLVLSYAGDPPLEPVSTLIFRNEVLVIYPYAWVVILQKDDTWEVARLD